MTPAALNAPGVTDTRGRIIDTAVRLFTRHSYAGTSLQMIADELSVTKAALYYHFHTREELLTAVVEPVLGPLRTIIEAAEAQRTPHARAEHLLTGYAALAVRNRAVISVLAADPGVTDVLLTQRDLGDLISRQVRLLADVDRGPSGQIKAAIVLGGIAVAVAPRLIDLDDDVLLQHLVEAGRRTLGLRTPRRATHNAAPGQTGPS
ncbi:MULTISPECIES: TetR/AcrR family transcriptional regulator [unclassified Parafrankia]|uniref:TetR/AcrR family transcriptional regulator n=1 Tax=unclassified Parafrankia TaxID=2994368 RepID=UPI000DA4595D|nr:TetR/AcrR family transcriptional regulator [Parafrankia sp. BMG5.11]TCJ32094.1 TetR/AcrR family transcriptional regulator [Parafrankia sp. BMG5.11]SQD97059.1 Transcriptional regulator [Parafrankia sp. Ea1.12]